MRDTFVYIHLWFASSEAETVCWENEQMEFHQSNTFRERAERNPCLMLWNNGWLLTNLIIQSNLQLDGGAAFLETDFLLLSQSLHA